MGIGKFKDSLPHHYLRLEKFFCSSIARDINR